MYKVDLKDITQVSTASLRDDYVYECVLRLEGEDKQPCVFEEFRAVRSVAVREQLLQDISKGATIAIDFVVNSDPKDAEGFFEGQNTSAFSEKKLITIITMACYLQASRLFDCQRPRATGSERMATVEKFVQQTCQYCLGMRGTHFKRQIKKAIRDLDMQ